MEKESGISALFPLSLPFVLSADHHELRAEDELPLPFPLKGKVKWP